MKTHRGKIFFTKRILCFFLGIILTAGFLTSIYAEEINMGQWQLNSLQYRFIGPQGNRFCAVTGVPGDTNIIYAGSASGGIFKSMDGGIHWAPIFDDQPVSSVSALAAAPSDPNVIWAGTGETFIRNDISVGIGVFKSTDSGKTWSHMGLPDSGRIPRIVIHPEDPEVVFVAAMGHCYGPQKEKGIFRTVDGGETWEKVLFIDEVTGCSDIVMDPNNPRILLAGMWPFQMTHWSRSSGLNNNGGLFLSKDGGTTWKKLSAGLPKPPTGKIAVAMSAADSNRMYALIESLEGTLWRSDNGGDSWRLMNVSHELMDRPSYYTRLAVSHDNADEVFTACNGVHHSRDGGKSFDRMYQMKGGDNHDIWVDPKNSDRMLVGNDQYVSISINRGKTWNGVRLPNAQMYHVAVDNQIPYFVYGNKQDGPSYRGPSNSKMGVIPSTLWHNVGGAEAGFTYPDPVNNNIIWSGNYQGILTRYDLETGHSRGVAVWREDNIGHPPKNLKYRFYWITPIHISPHDHNKVYVGSQYVHVTTNGGESWQIISPDLSTSAPDMLERNWGPLVAESADPIMSCTVFAIAESPVEEGQIWAGTNDGLLHVTRDGGENWTNVTKNIPDFPPRGKITNIEPSRYEAGTCYFAADLHEMNHWDTYIYKTTDFGKTWKNISSDIPKGYLSYAHCIREDPVKKGLLYLGTENALYVSFNDGDNWIPLNTGLPPAPVHWMVVQEHFNDLVVATYGRGFYILDDITPLQQLNPEVINSDVHLFDPRPAYRFLTTHRYDTHSNDLCMGTNPPYGATINYFLKSAPEGNVTLTVLNENGEKIRTLRGTKNSGINRVVWDLRYEILQRARLRTPPYQEHFVAYGPEGWRPVIQYGGGPIRVLAPPGNYTVRLSVGGTDIEKKVVVKKDPSSAGTEQDIQVQTELMLKIRKNQDDLIGMINSLEWLRKQIYDLEDVLKNDKGNEDVLEKLEALDDKMIKVEMELFQMRVTGRADVLRWPSGLYTKFASLAREISRADFPPTEQQIELHHALEEQLSSHLKRYRGILAQDLAAFNDLLKSKDIKNIVVVKNP